MFTLTKNKVFMLSSYSSTGKQDIKHISTLLGKQRFKYCVSPQLVVVPVVLVHVMMLTFHDDLLIFS